MGEGGVPGGEEVVVDGPVVEAGGCEVYAVGRGGFGVGVSCGRGCCGRWLSGVREGEGEVREETLEFAAEGGEVSVPEAASVLVLVAVVEEVEEGGVGQESLLHVGWEGG